MPVQPRAAHSTQREAAGSASQPSYPDVVSAHITLPVSAVVDLDQCPVDVLDGMRDGSRSSSGAQPLHRLGGAVPDPFPE